MEDIDFTNLYLGTTPTVENVSDGSIYYYPILESDKIVAVFAESYDQDGNIVAGTFSKAFSDTLNAFVQQQGAVALYSSGTKLYAVSSDYQSVLLHDNSDTSTIAADSNDISFSRIHPQVIDNVTKINVNIATLLTERNLNVPKVYQGQSPICWAASMASIINYMKGTNLVAANIFITTGSAAEGKAISIVKDYFSVHYQISSVLKQ